MFKNITIIFCVCFSWLYAEAESKSPDPEKIYFQGKKEIVICVNPNRKPFEYINKEGKYDGVLAEYANLFSQKLHIPFHLYKTETYRQSLKALSAGKCDLIVGTTATDKMKQQFVATQPYLKVSLAFATRKNTGSIQNFSQIAYAGNIGVLENTSVNEMLLKKYKYIKIVPCKNMEEGLQKVASGELLAFVATLPSLVYTLRQYRVGENIKIAGTFDKQVQFFMLLNGKIKDFLPVIDTIIDTLTEKEKQKILLKWVEAKSVKKNDNKFSYTLAVLLFLVFFMFALYYYHTYRMKRKVAEIYKVLRTEMKEEIEKNRQQQLLMLQQNRLAQKGEMLNMIAHQWRQPLNTLSLINQKLLFSYMKGEINDQDMASFKEKSERTIREMSDIINKFKIFFKPEKEKVEFEVRSSITYVLSILDPIMKTYNINIVFKVKNDIFAYGFPREFGQAVMNILMNAKEALVENKTKNPRIILRLWTKNGKVHLRICDNAGGISPEILPGIFDPYFSTKDEKNGTGLGLYMCKLIIEEHFNGHLNVNNTNEGACFNIVI